MHSQVPWLVNWNFIYRLWKTISEKVEEIFGQRPSAHGAGSVKYSCTWCTIHGRCSSSASTVSAAMMQDLWKRMTVHNTDYLKPIPQNEVSIDREHAISHRSLSLSLFGNLPARWQVHFIIAISIARCSVTTNGYLR